MHDYYLGGSHNFEADREAAEQVIAAIPGVRQLAAAGRAFLGRAVRHLLHQGVRQFLDIGSGIPTIGAVHDIAAAYPGTRVVYVDTDPVAVEYGVALLRHNPGAGAIRADLGHPEGILTHHTIRTMLDLGRPIGLLLGSVLTFVEDEHAYPAVARLRDVLAPGSSLVLTHILDQGLAADRADAAADAYRRSTSPILAHRDRNQISAFLHGLDLTEPGLVDVNHWRPTRPASTPNTPISHDREILMLGAVAAKARSPPPWLRRHPESAGAEPLGRRGWCVRDTHRPQRPPLVARWLCPAGTLRPPDRATWSPGHCSE